MNEDVKPPLPEWAENMGIEAIEHEGNRIMITNNPNGQMIYDYIAQKWGWIAGT